MILSACYILFLASWSPPHGQCVCPEWIVSDVKTTYVEKGPRDRYEIPNWLIGKRMVFTDSLMMIGEIRNNYPGSSLHGDYKDSVAIVWSTRFLRRSGSALDLRYPDDEITLCAVELTDTCTISDEFMKLIEVNDSDVMAYVSEIGSHSATRCFVFVTKEGEEMVLFSPNDSILLFLRKDGLHDHVKKP